MREYMNLSAWAAPESAQAVDQQTNFFSLVRIEEYVHHIRFPIPITRNYHYDFFLITQGRLLASDGLQPFSVSENELFFRAKGAISAIDNCAPNTKGYYGLFDAEYVLYNLKNQDSVDKLSFFASSSTPVIPLSIEVCLELSRQLQKLETIQSHKQPDNQEYLSAHLYSFLLDVAQVYGSREQSANSSSSASDLTTRFKHLLKQHILSKRAVRDYADLLNVTPNHLNRCVKEVTGKSASSWITDVLLLEAKVRLRQTSASIAEIAFQLSIEDVSYFARLFKKHTGMSPSSYRESTYILFTNVIDQSRNVASSRDAT